MSSASRARAWMLLMMAWWVLGSGLRVLGFMRGGELAAVGYETRSIRVEVMHRRRPWGTKPSSRRGLGGGRCCHRACPGIHSLPEGCGGDCIDTYIYMGKLRRTVDVLGEELHASERHLGLLDLATDGARLDLSAATA